MSTPPAPATNKLSDEEQKAKLSQLENESTRFADVYKKWADTSSNTRKNIEPQKCMPGMHIFHTSYYIYIFIFI